MTYFYSENKNSFYPDSMRDSYVLSSTWPDDAKEVDDAIFYEFTGEPPNGMVRGGKNGSPEWIVPPELSDEEKQKNAELSKSSLLSDVNQKTQIWQTQLTLGIISDSDKATLTKWMKYAQTVSAVDTTDIKNISWPPTPDE